MQTKQWMSKTIKYINLEKMLYLIGIFVCLCNAVFLFDNAIWGDEGFSLTLVRGNVKDILLGTAADVHPPLYYLILKAFVSILGESVFIGHVISYVAFVGTCFLVISFVRKNFGLISAYIAVLFVGWTEYAMVYNVEIRMYSIALFFVTLTFCMAYKVMNNGLTNEWILMSFFALLSGYTHYFALIMVAFIILGVFLFCVIRKQEEVGKKIGITVIVCIVGYMPWLLAMITTVTRTVGDFWLTGIPTFRECVNMFLGHMSYSYSLFILILILFLGYVLKHIIDVIRGKKTVHECVNVFLQQDCKLHMSILGIWTFMGTACLGIVVSKFLQPVLLTRYLYPLIVIGAITIGILLQYYVQKEKIGNVVVLFSVAIIVYMIVSGLNAYQTRKSIFEERKYNTNISLEIINEYVEQGYIVVSNNNDFKWTVLDYYYPNNWSEEIVDNNMIMLWEHELSDEEIDVMKDSYIIKDLQNQGQIDSAKFYMYKVDKN